MGALTLIAIVIMVLGFNYLKGVELFAKTKKAYVLLDEAAGIAVANPVYLYGRQIGKVSKVTELSPEKKKRAGYNVLFDLSVKKDEQIPKGSIIKIVETDLLGTKVLRISEPETVNGYMVDGDTILGIIKGNAIVELSEKAQPLLASADPMIKNVDSMISAIKGLIERNEKNLDITLSSLSRTMQNFEVIAKDVNEIVSGQKENIENILSNANDLVASISNNAGAIDSIIDNFNTFSGQLSELELNTVVGKLESTLGEAEKMLNAINNAEGTIGKLINEDGFYDNIDSTISSLNALLVDVKENPKKYVSISLIERKDKAKIIEAKAAAKRQK